MQVDGAYLNLIIFVLVEGIHFAEHTDISVAVLHLTHQNNITPIDQESTLFSYPGLLFDCIRTSGARYCGVPTSDVSIVRSLTAVSDARWESSYPFWPDRSPLS